MEIGALGKRLAYALTGLLLGLSQSLGLYLVSSNLGAIQGALDASAAEAAWMTTAYFATALSSSLLLVKVRLQYGLRPFAIVGLIGFVLVAALHLVTDSAATAFMARAALGIAAAPVSTMAVLYMVQATSPKMPPVGLVLGFASLQLGLPLSRMIPTALLEIGQWHGLFLPDVALALLSLAAILAFPLPPVERQRVFTPGDLPLFGLYALAWALAAVVLSLGRLYWWTDAPWLGVCLALAIALMVLYFCLEIGRAQPLIDLRWLATPYMLRFVAAIVLFRIVLSEQTIGIVGLMNVLGQTNEQMQGLFTGVAVAMLVGFGIGLAMAGRGALLWIGPLAAVCVAVAAAMDAGSTSLTRPQQLMISQLCLSAGLALFFTASSLQGFGPVIQDGSKQLVSFLAAFSAAQYAGSLLGTALISTLVVQRQRWHEYAIAQHLRLDDPQDALRLAQLGGALRGTLQDAGARSAQALALLEQQVLQQSYVLAYNDIFEYIAALAALMALWLASRAWRNRRMEPKQ